MTEEFKRQVIAALEANKFWNTARHLKPGMPGYKIHNRAQLAIAVDADPNTIKHMLGGARPGTKTKPIERSVYVGRIREKLELVADMKVPVRRDRASIVRYIADLPDAQFKVFETEVTRMMRGS